MELLTEKMKQFDRAQLRAAVFDLDGTLLDTVRDLGTAANVTLAHFGFPQHPLEAYQGFIGNGLLMLYRRAAPAGTDEATVEALRDYGRDYYREHCTGLTQVYDGVPELLHGLAARGIMLGMVTNKTEATARCVMAHYFPEVPFRFIWGNNGVRPLKPAPESGKLMLRELGLTPEQIAFTGDGDTDMAFASALGFWAFGACWGYRPRTVLAEQGADALDRTLKAFEMKFGRYLKGLKWMNFGGGHHITKEGYDIDLLCKCIERVRDRYGVQVYLEPGEAVALNAGVLVSTVLDVVRADMPVAILDTSAATHMPDVLEMPYRPMVIGSGEPGEKRWSCRLAGKSCLAGDVIGEYSFDEPLKAGDRLVFTDMAIYSMVKTTTFNGLRLPSIVRWNPETDETRLVREFGYEDFKMRLS